MAKPSQDCWCCGTPDPPTYCGCSRTRCQRCGHCTNCCCCDDEEESAIFGRVAERIREKVATDGKYLVGTDVLCEVVGYDVNDAARAAQLLASTVGVWWHFENERQSVWFGYVEALGPAPSAAGGRK